MTVIRVEHKCHYTVLSNGTLRDGRLSYRARGVLAYLLSYSDGTNVDSTLLADAAPEGRDAIRTALKELETHGYIERRKEQFPDGTWRSACVVRETPGQTEDGKPGAGDWKPVDDFQSPAPGKPTSDNPALKDFEVLNEKYKSFRDRDPGNPQGGRYPELKRPAREQRILDGEFGQQH